MNRYVALEGIDGAGKTSVSTALALLLEEAGHEVMRVREPGGTAAGEGLRRILLDGPPVTPWAEALMFAAARAQLVTDVIRPALDRGAWVLSDRSVYSSLAYQGAGRQLGVDRVRRINQPGLGSTWPDVVLLLTVSPQQGLDRQARPDRIGSQGLAFLEAVAKGFAGLARDEPDRFVVVDAGRPMEQVLAAAWNALEARA
ncbi:MAG: dTMP kinase [Acidimicrobiia bacterium]|nr:dTMP kinase [Acidimicrobiia bacterium]